MLFSSICMLNINNILYIDGVPYDGVPEEEVVTVHTSVTVILAILATAGLVFTVVCLAFNFIFRKRR